MKIVVSVLVCVLIALQYRIWVGEGSLAHINRLKKQIAEQTALNDRLKKQNAFLESEVYALKNGFNAIEGKAREQLGLIKKGETFFLFVEPQANKAELVE